MNYDSIFTNIGFKNLIVFLESNSLFRSNLDIEKVKVHDYLSRRDTTVIDLIGKKMKGIAGRR